MSRRLNFDRVDGSIPIALIASIVVAGIASVLLARTVQGERTTRFDRAFTGTLHSADAGVNQALFQLNAGTLTATIGTTVGPFSQEANENDVAYSWTATRTAQREWRITSDSTENGTTRRVVAVIQELPRFFPGAFGDEIVALNGTSSDIDSYDPGCATLSRDCGWGNTTTDVYQQTFGTGNGSIGTNGDLDLSGNVDVRPGGAYLYDWIDNPPSTGSITASNPFGSRCDGTTRCTYEYVSTVDEKLEYDTPEKMGFITDKFASGGACETVSGNTRYAWGADAKVGGSKANQTLEIGPYETSTNFDATSEDFTNFYCAESLEFISNIKLANSATPDNPVVFFVRDYVKIPSSGTLVACHDAAGSSWCQSNDPRRVQPLSSRLQIYVAGQGANDVFFKSQSMFAGIIYAPKSRCGGAGNAGADVYGVMICGSMDNVGNWDFHFDDSLGRFGSSEYSVGTWREETPTP